MKFSTLAIFQTIAAVFCAKAVAAAGVPVPKSLTDILAKKPEPMRFTGSISAGGPTVDITGTIDEVFPKLKKLYPKLKPDLSPTTSLPKRWFPGPPTCYSTVGADRYTILNHAVPHLKALGNLMCEVRVPRTCLAAYCAPSPNSGVFLCTEAAGVRIPCRRMGENAELIANTCIGPVPGRTTGTRWDNTGYHIVVAGVCGGIYPKGVPKAG
ncbi:hypothetical protein TWF730_000269 [Orbilia blumenaviensis]|uniref:Uncharacterized protein n=1 Tax=Orbilia blumenaviensis TaxID=1796055 RepID=A0AAV9VP79_9PEZI